MSLFVPPTRVIRKDAFVKLKNNSVDYEPYVNYPLGQVVVVL